MIGILVVTHGEMAEGIKSALDLIVGEHQQLSFLGLKEGVGAGDFKSLVKKEVTDLDNGEGVLIFTDLFGATPYNTTAWIYSDLKDIHHYRSVSGMNLAMVIDALFSRENHSLDDLVQKVMKSGHENIVELFEKVGGKTDG